MHATQVPRPFHTKGWVYEEKYDGWRMVAYKVAGSVKLTSRNGRDHTSRIPGIVAALRKLDATGLILDGEVAVWSSTVCKPVARISGGSRSTSAAT
jgi:bifunctional non-homologous end joining protein LigD